MHLSASYYWLGIIIVMSILEACTCQLVSIWFVVAAIISLVMSFFNVSLFAQILTFIISSFLMIVLTKPIIKKYLTVKKVATNIDRYIGMDAVVTEGIDNLNGKGQVNVSGIVWTARSLTKDIIKKGDLVEIKQIDGVKLIVEKKENEQ